MFVFVIFIIHISKLFRFSSPICSGSRSSEGRGHHVGAGRAQGICAPHVLRGGRGVDIHCGIGMCARRLFFVLSWVGLVLFCFLKKYFALFFLFFVFFVFFCEKCNYL